MSNSKNQINWHLGDLFLVPLADGSSVVGQVVAQEKSVLNSVSCAFFDQKIKSSAELQFDNLPSLDTIFSVLFVTRDLLDDQKWIVVGNRPISLPSALFPYEGLRGSGYVGAKVTGSSNVTKFLNAFYALAPWDMMKDPDYFDRFLVTPDRKPKNLLYKQS